MEVQIFVDNTKDRLYDDDDDADFTENESRQKGETDRSFVGELVEFVSCEIIFPYSNQKADNFQKNQILFRNVNSKTVMVTH